MGAFHPHQRGKGMVNNLSTNTNWMQLVYLSEVGTLKWNNPIHIENFVIELIIHCNAYLRLLFVSY